MASRDLGVTPPEGWQEIEAWHWLKLNPHVHDTGPKPLPLLWLPEEAAWTNEGLWDSKPLKLSAHDIQGRYLEPLR